MSDLSGFFGQSARGTVVELEPKSNAVSVKITPSTKTKSTKKRKQQKKHKNSPKQGKKSKY